MRQAERDRERMVHTLLDLWMGERTPGGQRRRGHLPVLIGMAAVAAIIVVLARSAVDILLIALAVALVVVCLHFIADQFVRSDLVQPGWLLIIVLSIGFLVWLFVPEVSLSGLGGNRARLPRPIARALAWSEAHGLHVAIFNAEAETPAPTVQEPAPVDSTAPTAGTATAPSLMVTATSNATMIGRPVTFMARVVNSAAGVVAVRFYDGEALLGVADVKEEGRVRIAYYTVRSLSVGEHEIKAVPVGMDASAGRPSAPLRHVVLRESP